MLAAEWPRMRTCIALLLTGLAACTEPASVEPEPLLLALGDSIAFGYEPMTDHSTNAGYPEILGARLGLEVTNASCPGEASGGFLSLEGNDNGCRENRLKYPLHVSYQGSQLAFAIEFLTAHPGTQLVTIDIGGNDISKLNDQCAEDVQCKLGGFPGMLDAYGKNLDLIFGELHKVYDGPLVALSIYNPFPTDEIAAFGISQLNRVLSMKAARWNVVFADGMVAFEERTSDPCADGLLIPMPGGTCDIHPSHAGDELLADTIEAAMP
jgi:lysophospholipase L1-like esterase